MVKSQLALYQPSLIKPHKNHAFVTLVCPLSP